MFWVTELYCNLTDSHQLFRGTDYLHILWTYWQPPVRQHGYSLVRWGLLSWSKIPILCNSKVHYHIQKIWHWTLSWATWNQSSLPPSIYLKCPEFPSSTLTLWGFPTNVLIHILLPTSVLHDRSISSFLILSPTIFYEQCKIWSSFLVTFSMFLLFL